MAMGSLLAKVQSHTMPSPQGRWLEGKRTRVSQWLRNRRTDGMKCDWKQWRMTKLWSFEGDTTDIIWYFQNHTYNSGNLCPCFSVSTTLKETCQLALLALYEKHQMCQFNIKRFSYSFPLGGIIVCIECIPAITNNNVSLDGILAHIYQNPQRLKQQWLSSPPLLHTKQ